MKLILQKDVEKLGYEGDLVDVAPGYGRNYLLPRGLAVKADAANLSRLDHLRKRREARREREVAEARELAERLEKLEISITARVGEGGRLFGSVTAADIARTVNQLATVELDHRRVAIDQPIKQLGTYEVPVRLQPEVTAKLHVAVVAETEEAGSGE